jgi:hypothetical protein
MSRNEQAFEAPLATVATVPTRYHAALNRLAGAIGEARALAEVLDNFARLLRGDLPGPEALPLELFPSAASVRRALERRDRALDAAAQEWERLAAEDREVLRQPGELLAGEVLE